MKTRFIAISTLLILSLFSLNIMAQNGPRQDFPNGERNFEKGDWLPGLTDEQKDAIKEIRLEGMKQQLPLKNKKDELKAQLKTEMTADQPNETKINNLIEEIGKIDIDKQKIRAKSRLEIRKLLNEEQRLVFDMRMERKGSERGDRAKMNRPHRGMKGAPQAEEE